MANNETYLNNDIELKKTGRTVSLYINKKKIPVKKTNDLPGGFCSSYSYLPSSDLLQLGKHIVDAQLSLKKSSLSGIRKGGK